GFLFYVLVLFSIYIEILGYLQDMFFILINKNRELSLFLVDSRPFSGGFQSFIIKFVASELDFNLGLALAFPRVFRLR
ncbi:unnamed protein product, partial [Arabidopsis halleri]